jgi:large subunit ribosomal protein L29
MKMKDIREKEAEQLRHELAEQQKQLFTLRTQSVTEKLEDPSQIRKARKSIAQIKTVLRQQELEAAKSAKNAAAAK